LGFCYLLAAASAIGTASLCGHHTKPSPCSLHHLKKRIFSYTYCGEVRIVIDTRLRQYDQQAKPCDRTMKANNSAIEINPTAQPPPPLQTSSLSDMELLCGLLYSGKLAAERILHARDLLQKFGGLRGLQIASRLPANERKGLDERAATRIRLAHEMVHRQLKQTLQRGVSLTSPAMTLEYLQTALRDRKREIFTCLFLDTRHRVIATEDLFQGSIDGACVYPRVVAERALRLSAAAVIVAHNHPSGISEPSLADQAITRRLKDALLLLEIRLLDHFVVGDGPPVSMASRGML
jgi:DNA repair protein RadC